MFGLCLLTAALAFAAAPPGQAAWLVIDDFEGRLVWELRPDGGHPPQFERSAERCRSGRWSLKLEYQDQPPHWGSIQRPIKLSGQETAIGFWLYVQAADPKAAMHIWLFEPDGDGWVARVSAEGRDRLQPLAGRWVRVELPLSKFSFQPRGRRTKELWLARTLVINCNWGSFAAFIDDIAFQVPREVARQVQQEAERRARMRDEALRRSGWRRCEKGNIAVFRDEVAPPREGTASDPQWLGEVLSAAGYHVTYLSAAELALPELLSPEYFDLLVLPYGPRFPAEAAEALVSYLQRGGRFLCVGGYAFDEPYFAGGSPQSQLQNGGFEGWRGGTPEGWEISPRRPGFSVSRASDRSHSGRASAHLRVDARAPVDFYRVLQRTEDFTPGRSYILRGFVWAGDFQDGPGAYLAVDFYRASGERISFAQTGIVKNTGGWRQLELRFTVPPQTQWLQINCIAYGRGEAWFDDIALTPAPPTINTRHARARDMLHTSRDQIPVFDPSYRLEDASVLEAAPDQRVIENFRRQGSFEGYAAVTLWGQNTAVKPKPYARWIPLLQCRDRFGRLRGTAAAIIFHHDGPWRGSSWAIFGITNVDLFRRGDAAGKSLLLKTVDCLLRGLYLACPEPRYMSYRDGEAPQATVLVCNDGLRPRQVAVRAELIDARSGRPVAAAQEKRLRLRPGEKQSLAFQWPPMRFESDLYEVRFTLLEAGQTLDALSTGFVAFKPNLLSRGPAFAWRNNAFSVGESPPHFLLGTNQTGVVLGPWWENPLRWDRELSLMRDFGLRILRVLHISSFAGDLTRPDERMLRRLDALVQLCQLHGIALMPCMHDWLGGISIPSNVLEQESRFAQILAERYRSAPAVIIDIENEAPVVARDIPELRDMFNRFLRERYSGDVGALRQVWGDAASFGKLRFVWPRPKRGWADRRWLDVNLFRRQLVERWLRANVEAMRQVNTRHAITDEYYLLPAGDAGRANEYCDFVNIHCYTIDWPEQLKYYDHCLEGMGFAVGEFGRRSHPSFVRGWGWAPENVVRLWFWRLIHLAFGACGSFACNWDWKDMESCIFPWGLMYPCDLVPKSQAIIMRDLSLALGAARLDWRPPEVCVLVADLHALAGPDDHNGWLPARRCIEALQKIGARFGVLHDFNLDKLPASVRVIFYPCPMMASDETLDALEAFMGRGGILYVSGDLSYDELGRPGRIERLRRLCGVAAPASLEPQADLSRQPWKPMDGGLPQLPAAALGDLQPAEAEVLARDAAGRPVFFRHAIGRGSVFYLADVPEMTEGGPAPELYAWILDRSGVQRLHLSPPDPRLRLLVPDTLAGRGAVVFFDAPPAETISAEVMGASLGLAGGTCAAIVRDADGPRLMTGVQSLACDGIRLSSRRPSLLAIWADESLKSAATVWACAVPIEASLHTAEEVRLALPGAKAISVGAGEIAEGRWRRLERLQGNEIAPGEWLVRGVRGDVILRIEVTR